MLAGSALHVTLQTHILEPLILNCSGAAVKVFKAADLTDLSSCLSVVVVFIYLSYSGGKCFLQFYKTVKRSEIKVH